MNKLFFVLLLALSTSAQAFELMKCTSRRSGTIWGSFGHLYRSGEDKVIHFPTEIVLFGSDVNGRLLFPTLEEALKIPMTADDAVGRMHLEFSVPKGAGVQNHLLQIFRYDPRNKNGYMGNWTISEAGQPDRMDEAACSLD